VTQVLPAQYVPAAHVPHDLPQAVPQVLPLQLSLHASPGHIVVVPSGVGRKPISQPKKLPASSQVQAAAELAQASRTTTPSTQRSTEWSVVQHPFSVIAPHAPAPSHTPATQLPAEHVPQLPPQPSSPQTLPPQLGLHVV